MPEHVDAEVTIHDAGKPGSLGSHRCTACSDFPNFMRAQKTLPAKTCLLVESSLTPLNFGGRIPIKVTHDIHREDSSKCLSS